MSSRAIVIALILILATTTALFAQNDAVTSWPIVEDGKPQATIIVASGAGTAAQVAAKEVAKYVEKMSGTKLPITTASLDSLKAGSSEGTGIFIGAAFADVLELELPDEETLVVQTSSLFNRPAIVLMGKTDVGALYAAYQFLELLGVRFFHPDDEYVPTASVISVDWPIDITESAAFEERGIQQHTLHPIPHTTIFMEEPTEENLQRSFNYVDWLAKNRQNYLYWWWVERVDPKERKDYINKITAYAHDRGVKVGMVVGMPFNQQNSYNIMKSDAKHSETEKWKAGLRKGVDEMAALGLDSLCVFFAENEGEATKMEGGVSPVQATLERIKALQEYVSKKYPHMKILLWVHPTAWASGDENLPNFFFLPKLAPKEVGAAVHTVQFYNLFDPAPTYGNRNFHHLREFALEQAKVREVWYWPETSYACGFDAGVPQYWPVYISGRWVDADFFAGKISGHITFSTGLEWMYWLNDYAVARFGWNPKVYDPATVTDEFASIFNDHVASVVTTVLMDLMRANEHYLVRLSNKPELNLMNLFSVGPIGPEFDRLGSLSKEELADWRSLYLPALEEFTDMHAEALSMLVSVEDYVGEQEKPWFDELRDSVEITYLRSLHQFRAFSTASGLLMDQHTGSKITEADVSDLETILGAAKSVIERREEHYRYPNGGYNGPYNGYFRPFNEWERITDAVKQYFPVDMQYDGITDALRAVPFKVRVHRPVGSVYTTAIVIPEDYPVDRQLSLLMIADDLDSPDEGTAIIAGKEYPLPETGNSGQVKVQLDFPPGTFKHGRNEIKFRFDSDVNGTTGGYSVIGICLGVMKT